MLVAVNVPEGDSQDLFFHFEAPSGGNAWGAFGMGEQMGGSLMFVVYESENSGAPPTVSPRLGKGHVMPQYTSDVNITVLEGSQVTSDSFIANFQCHDCRSWSGGNVDVTSTSAPFIYAIGPSGNLQSNDPSASISQHGSNFQNNWSLNMKQATGAEGVPLSSTSPGNGGTSNNSTGSNNGTTSDPGNNNNNNNNDNDNDDGGNVVYIPAGVLFHGGVMGLAFALIYPLGYLFLRLFEKVWLHAGIQSFALLLTFLGVGSGIAVSKRDQIVSLLNHFSLRPKPPDSRKLTIFLKQSPNLTHPHQIIGLIVFILILATWTIGLIGHMHYKRTQTPHPIMKGHRILGPLMISLGSVNACIGFAWVGLRGAAIGYILFSLFIMLVVLSLVFLKNRRKMRRNAMNSTAAFNFREGQGQYGQNVPMQPMGGQGQQQHGPVEYYNVQPPK